MSRTLFGDDDKPRPKKRSIAPNPDIQTCVDYFDFAFRRHFKGVGPLTPNYGRFGHALVGLLAAISKEDVCALIDLFFEKINTDFYVKRCKDYGPSDFVSVVQRLQLLRNGFRSVDDRTADNMD